MHVIHKTSCTFALRPVANSNKTICLNQLIRAAGIRWERISVSQKSDNIIYFHMRRLVQDGQKSVSVFSSNFSKMVKDTKMKLAQLKEIRLTNYMMPNLWKSFNRTDFAIIISNGSYATLICACARSGHHYVQGTSKRTPRSWHPSSLRCLRGRKLSFYKIICFWVITFYSGKVQHTFWKHPVILVKTRCINYQLILKSHFEKLTEGKGDDLSK